MTDAPVCPRCGLSAKGGHRQIVQRTPGIRQSEFVHYDGTVCVLGSTRAEEVDEELSGVELWELERGVARAKENRMYAAKVLRLIAEVKLLREEGAAPRRSEIMDSLYHSEINAEIASFFACGFRWRIGDELNGWKATGEARSYGAAMIEMARAAADLYPKSQFAKWFRPN